MFLDRDGVINANIIRNGRPVSPRHMDDFRLLPGVESAVEKLQKSGLRIVVVTNQPDLRTGHILPAALEAMHGELLRRLPIDSIRVCPHTDADVCGCRKPKPGLILSAAEELKIDIAKSYLVGDRWRDTLAARAAGCFAIFVEDGTPQERPHDADHVVTSLSEAADYILARIAAGR